MKKYLLLFLSIGIILLGSSCASKRYAKRGLKYEQAGMYEMAAESYLKSLQANSNNIDARIGLKKNGQRLLDKKSLGVQGAYESGDDKSTVYNYIDAKGYQDLVGALGVELLISERTTDMFKDSKPKYIEKIYNEAQLDLDEEKFKVAEDLFAEVQRLEPGYGNTNELMKVSKSEPLYRQGKEFMNSGFYRKAYFNFDQIIRGQGTYKDSKELRDEALSKGLIAIAINRIDNQSSYSNAQTIIESKIRTTLNNLKNPFITIVDNKNTDQLIQEQQRALNQGSDIVVGKLIAPKALFTGNLLNFNSNEGRLSKQEKRGYLKEEIITKDPTTGQSKKDYKYHKVIYFEYHQTNQASGSFQYQLTSTETSAVLVSDAMDINASDEAHFATFEGNVNLLVPGYWEDIKKDSPKDKVSDSGSEVDALQKLLKASRNIKTIEALRNEVTDKIADRVAKKINSYNPEEQ